MYPSAHGTTNFDTVLPKELTTIAQHMKQKGYFTAALLSSPEFEINPALKESFSRGFERYEYLAQTPRAFPARNEIKKGISELSDKKFFWWVGVGGVHWPYGAQGPNVFADEKYNGIFKDIMLLWQQTFENIYQGKHYMFNAPVVDSDVQYVRDQYDNGARAFDEFLRRFMNELEQRNLLDRTLIVIQSEHGEDLHEHGYFAHYDILDTQTHVPLLILSPRFTQERRVSSFASSVDVFPTVTEFLGHASLNQFQGKSLASIINGSEKDSMRQEVFLERNPLWEETKATKIGFEARGIAVGTERHKDIGIRTSQWKYIERMSKETMERINWWQMISGEKLHFPAAELYDLVNDPGETKNVIDQHPNEASVLREKLTKWFENILSSSQEVDIEPVIQPYF